ncbi:MAG: D-mannonate oxidoreductase [Ignavibacteriae bacterium HGW-Ignavibacteriae-2]|jgi:NAD(P)-dependent dehydrogenase (short-subunit alcohol dehydrogenase family)|nr:MAG: D-mannonate oxidoreductase [Ignavibacteriae bacterium HGW-Ignavibacteriae-2]
MKYNLDSLKGKVCVITGGGGVIGTALAIGLGEVGAKVAILDFIKDSADKTADLVTKNTGSKAIGVFANVLDKESLIKAKEEINAAFGKIDVLINGAGGNAPTATTKDEFLKTDSEKDLLNGFFGLDLGGFQRVFDLNFMGTLLPTLVFAVDLLNRDGIILNISSMNSFRPLTKIPAYSAAKASVNNFTEWLSVHFAKAGVRVNAIAPGFFVTQQNQFLLYKEDTTELTERGHKIISNTPMGKFGEPEDLLGTMFYLLSDLSKFVTGVVIPVDGGFNAYSGV